MQIFGAYTQLVGQIFGFIAVILAFIALQMKTHRQVLVMYTMIGISMCINYFLLGAYPGMALNLFGLVRNWVYSKPGIFKGKWWPAIMTVIMLGIGLFSWNGPQSLLVIAGLLINTYALSFEDPQHLRISILISSPMVLAYDILTFSLGGILLEAFSIVSSIIGLVRYRKQDK